MRSPTRVEVDSSLYLESPDEAVQPPAKRFSHFNFILLVALTNTAVVFVKKKLMERNEEDFFDILVFLGVVNLGLALLYIICPFACSSLASLWSVLAKRRQQPTEVAVVTPPPLPLVQPREPEAPPPPYHIAVDSSTPPPSYFDIFDK